MYKDIVTYRAWPDLLDRCCRRCRDNDDDDKIQDTDRAIKLNEKQKPITRDRRAGRERELGLR